MWAAEDVLACVQCMLVLCRYQCSHLQMGALRLRGPDTSIPRWHQCVRAHTCTVDADARVATLMITCTTVEHILQETTRDSWSGVNTPVYRSSM